MVKEAVRCGAPEYVEILCGDTKIQVRHLVGRALNVSISCNGVFKLNLPGVSMENLPKLELYTEKRGDVYELVEAVLDVKEKTPVRNPDAVRKREGDIGWAVGGQFGVYIPAQPQRIHSTYYGVKPHGVRTSIWRSQHGRTKLANTKPRQVQYGAIRKTKKPGAPRNPCEMCGEFNYVSGYMDRDRKKKICTQCSRAEGTWFPREDCRRA